MNQNNDTIRQSQVDSKSETVTKTEGPNGTETVTKTETVTVQGPKRAKAKFFGLGAIAGVAVGIGGTVAYQRYGGQVFGGN